VWRAELIHKEIQDELQFHIDMRAEENMRQGLQNGEAQRDAERRFGNLTRIQEQGYDVRGGQWLEALWQDFRYGARILAKTPSFTLVVVLTLALGVGANSGVFSVVNALILRPLPYHAPEQLVWVEEISKTNANNEVPSAHFIDWQEQSKSLEGIAAVDDATRTLSGSGEPERVQCGKISASFFPVLGAPLVKGRNFTAAEDNPGAERVAIISHGVWQRRYNGDQDVVGKTITLNDANFTVIGVLSENFRYFQPFEVWVPLAIDLERDRVSGNSSSQPTLARLKPGVTREQARVELNTILQRYEAAKPEGVKHQGDRQVKLVPLQEHFLGDRRRPVLVLLGAVALVLLIACANVANLLLARGVTRQKELAIRAALGAGWFRLTRQILTECLLLALVGGAAGLLLAYWLTRFISSLNSADTIGEMARVSAITIDLRVLGFTLLISLLTGMFFGLLSALQLSRPDFNVSLKEGGRGSSSHRRGLRNALMVSEVALAIVLLVGSGLLIRSFIKLVGVDPGYTAENLLTARLPLPSRYRENSQRVQFYEQTLQRLASAPGVTAVGATSHLPLLGYNLGAMLSVEGRAPLDVPISSVNPDYFRTMGIVLRSGRLFNDGDTQGAPSVAALSETLARRLFPDANPLGKQFKLPGSGAELTTVVGVVSDVRHKGLDRDIENALYLNFRQTPREMALVLRSAVEPSRLAPALRNVVREVDPALPVYDVMTMNERLSNSIATRRFNMLLLGGFAALALLLASVGVYGVIAYVVTERTHEVGIRVALGAQSADVLSLFIKQGMAIVSLGVGLGLLGAFALTRVMTSLLFGVGATDPLTFAGVALLLSLIALLACYLPARRAARIDPLVSLRYE
jgi:putative ABC transport system permease protein